MDNISLNHILRTMSFQILLFIATLSLLRKLIYHFATSPTGLPSHKVTSNITVSFTTVSTRYFSKFLDFFDADFYFKNIYIG